MTFYNFSYANYDNMISSSIELARKSVAEFAEHAMQTDVTHEMIFSLNRPSTAQRDSCVKALIMSECE